EAVLLPSCPQLFDVALGPVSEVEVRTDDDAPNFARRTDAIDEGIRGQLRERSVEPEHPDGVGAGFAEEPYAVADVGERRSRRSGCQYLDREGIERGGDRGGVLAPRTACERRDQGTVPEVDAVEDADREMDRSARPPDEVAKRIHAAEYQSAAPTPAGEGSGAGSSGTGITATAGACGDVATSTGGPGRRDGRRRAVSRTRRRCVARTARNGRGGK